jgi:hypothetical protein
LIVNAYCVRWSKSSFLLTEVHCRLGCMDEEFYEF